MSLNGDSLTNERKLEEGQKWVFLATFTNYAMAHWTRKSYTNGNIIISIYLYIFLLILIILLS